jgi:hypothetical protein
MVVEGEWATSSGTLVKPDEQTPRFSGGGQDTKKPGSAGIIYAFHIEGSLTPLHCRRRGISTVDELFSPALRQHLWADCGWSETVVEVIIRRAICARARVAPSM